jgi:hypothetical protein
MLQLRRLIPECSRVGNQFLGRIFSRDWSPSGTSLSHLRNERFSGYTEALVEIFSYSSKESFCCLGKSFLGVGSGANRRRDRGCCKRQNRRLWYGWRYLADRYCAHSGSLSVRYSPSPTTHPLLATTYPLLTPDSLTTHLLALQVVDYLN